MKKAAKILLVLLAIFAVLVLLGPRPDAHVAPRSFSIDDPAGYVAEVEQSFSDVLEGAEKTIVWHGDEGGKTPVSVVYLHGFSATRQETAPLSDSVAARLGANLFYTRLTGHGRGGEAMAEATAGDWFNDVSEAVAVGRAIGDQVVLIGNSTGSTLVVWWLGSEEAPVQLKQSVGATILMSPNFSPADSNSRFLLWPWGELLAELMIGEERSWEPHNELQGRYWTTRYPTEAIVTVMAAVGRANDVDPARLLTPTMVIYSEGDSVIDVSRIRPWYERLGSTGKRIIQMQGVGDPSNHILAGSIMSPESTEPLAREIETFLVANAVPAIQ